MQFYDVQFDLKPLSIPLLSWEIPAGFPSPAADHVETRVDLNMEIIKIPSFTSFAEAY